MCWHICRASSITVHGRDMLTEIEQSLIVKRYSGGSVGGILCVKEGDGRLASFAVLWVPVSHPRGTVGWSVKFESGISWPRDYIFFSFSTEHEISTAHENLNTDT